MFDAETAAPRRATDTTNREISWFAQRVEKGRAEPFVEIVTITPTIAARLLEMNDGNRPINERLVREIAADIEHGFWQLNGETIIVSKDGLLNDGQHRLEAVIRTGRAIQIAVMFGVDRSARMTVDMGAQRSASNFLAMNNVAYATHAAAVTKALIYFEKGIYSTGGGIKSSVTPPTKQEIRAYYEKNKRRIDAAIHELVNDKFIKNAGATAFIACYVILHKINAVECGVFFQRICDGANLKSTDSILWLRARFTSDWKKRRHVNERIEMILRHWNRWRLGAKLSRQIPLEGSFPKIEK